MRKAFIPLAFILFVTLQTGCKKGANKEEVKSIDLTTDIVGIYHNSNTTDIEVKKVSDNVVSVKISAPTGAGYTELEKHDSCVLNSKSTFSFNDRSPGASNYINYVGNGTLTGNNLNINVHYTVYQNGVINNESDGTWSGTK